jgi:class 3 adenylate cyclase
MVWGINEGEYLDDPELVRRYTRLDVEDGGFDDWEFGPVRIDAMVEGSVGWSLAHADAIFSDGHRREFRSSLIFHLEDDEWKIVHEHWSFGADESEWGKPEGRTLSLISQAAANERPDLDAWTSAEGTTTLAFTDIEGSTALNAAFGDEAWMKVLHVHNQVVNRATREHAGTVVKSQGDGFMLAFSSARKALACAQTIQSQITEAFDDPGSPIRVRIGVHTGEMVASADDFFGHAVNYAARIAGAARAGEILVSQLVHQLTAQTGGFAFNVPRTVELKGVEGPVTVYPLRPPALARACRDT